LKLGVLPIVNENDTVSTAELDYLNIRAGERIFSDNDRLAALVMSHIEADALVLLTDVDGLMQLGPSGSKEASAKVIPLVEEITPELKTLALGPSEGGRGGMLTKLDAAEIAMQAGGVAVIANGKKQKRSGKFLRRAARRHVFLPKTRMAGKRRWIAYAAGVRGRVIVNAGRARGADGRKGELAGFGSVGVEGEFDAAEVVSIVDDEGLEFARGISDYSCGDAQGMIGNGSQGPEAGGRTSKRATVLVKRDNIVLMDRK
jgi:glutamate 5-kinase